MTNYSIGSTWRKWDLHFHTPSSYDYGNFAITNEDIVESLIEAQIEVVAITDHHVIDVPRILELKKLAAERLTILPGIELRSEYGSKPIHYIGLFSEQVDLGYLWDTIKGALGLTPTDIKNKGGDHKVYVPLADAHKVFKKLGGLISIHAGGKSNSVEGISNKEQFQRRLKLDLTKTMVDILEVGQIKDIQDYLGVVFPATGLDLPLIIGSDNHDAGGYAAPANCWVKANPNFLGLRQVLNEPRERVCLGENPRQLTRLEEDKTRIIESLCFSRRAKAAGVGCWFEDVALELNPGLIAIIGNQGNGKSALAEVLGLLGNTPHEESFAFLNKEQFRHPRDGQAENFDATMTWKSGKIVRKNLAERVVSGERESIRCIPQFHLDRICDEIKGGRRGHFENELRGVIFSRIPLKDRLSLPTLDLLLSRLTDRNSERIRILEERLDDEIVKLVMYESRLPPEYANSLTQELERIEDEIQAHEEARPTSVPDPAEDPVIGEVASALREQVEQQAKAIKRLVAESEGVEKKLASILGMVAAAERVRGRLENLELRWKEAKVAVADDCQLIGLDADELCTISFNRDLISRALTEFHRDRKDQEWLRSEENPEGLPTKKVAAQKKAKELTSKLDHPSRAFRSYQESLEGWQKKRAAFIGDAETPGTKKYVEKYLAELPQVPGRIREARARARDISLEILNNKREILTVNERLHKPVQEFIDTHPIARDRFGLQFWVSLMSTDFEKRFLDFINQSRKGSFCGEEQGQARIHELVTKADLQSSEGVSSFLGEIEEHLHRDMRSAARAETYPVRQLRQDYDLADLYKLIYSFDYLQPRYELRWIDKPLSRLSPGERGTLLLIFFLLIDDSRVPLVIDQPEGNLDNQTVYELLVDCVKEARQRRQIILVTHNPNLAVVCDAEQIIHARLDKRDSPTFVYESGALEDRSIGRAVVNVLEGTRPAIEKRVAKYSVIFDEVDSGET